MRRARIAEWILALSITRERAGAVTGDLRESGRGALWFWRSVLATMLASVWSDFRSAWWKMVLASLALDVIWIFVELQSIAPILARSVPLYLQLNLALNWLQAFAVPFLVARFFRRRELATLLARFFAGTAVGGILLVFLLRSPGAHHSAFNFSWFLSWAVSLAAVICARLLPRRMNGFRLSGAPHA